MPEWGKKDGKRETKAMLVNGCHCKMANGKKSQPGKEAANIDQIFEDKNGAPIDTYRLRPGTRASILFSLTALVNAQHH